MFDEFDDALRGLEKLHLSYQKQLSRLCTFPIDYVESGVYGVYAQDRKTRKRVLLDTNENVWELFQYITDIAGTEAVCEMSDMAILLNDMEDIVEDIDDDEYFRS